MFERSNIIRPITAHQRCIAESLQCRYHKLLLLWHDAGKHFDVGKQPVDCVILRFR